MKTIRYVGIGPNTKRTFVACGVRFIEGVGDVPEDIHRHAGHLLKDTYGVMPASELPVVEGGRDANGDGEADVGPRGGKLDEPKSEETVTEVVVGDTESTVIEKPVEPVRKGKRK